MVRMRDIQPRFETWLRQEGEMPRAVVTSMAPVEGGASNVTLRVELEGAAVPAVVLRLQRETGIFQPYDVAREGEILRALANTAVPVPGVLAIERNATVLGAPFVVLEWVDAPHMGVAGGEADFGAFTAMVAAIHNEDWRRIPPDVLPRPTTVAEATRTEVALVAARIDAFGLQSPLLDRGHELLQEHIPSDGELCLCQGDVNVFNFLFREREVVAVVDWEQAHIGDPRSDIGQLVALSHLKGAPFGEAREMPFARAYEAVSGRSMAGLEYFRALWAWQLSFIYRAWVASNDSAPWYTGDEADSLLDRCLAEIG